MTFRKIKHRLVVCTRDLVRKFAQMEGCPGDRHFSEKRAAVIKKAIIKETFRGADFAGVYCKATKKTYRVNGKHTAIVLSDLGARLPKGLEALVEQYEADDLADVSELYATFDHRRSARQSGDINRSYAGSDTELSDLPRRVVNVSVSGISFAKWGQEMSRHEAEERASLLISHRDFVIWLASTCPQDHKYRHLLRTAIVAAMFRTFQRNKKAATEFWQLVAEENHASNKHPTRVLARWLLTHDVYAGAHHAGRQQLDTMRGLFIRCLVAWNAWRHGKREVELRFQHQDKIPAVA